MTSISKKLHPLNAKCQRYHPKLKINKLGLIGYHPNTIHYFVSDTIFLKYTIYYSGYIFCFIYFCTILFMPIVYIIHSTTVEYNPLPQHPISYDSETTIPAERKRAVWEAIEWLELFLEGEKYVAGGAEPSLADLYLMSSMLSLVCVGCKVDRFVNISAWMERNKYLPGYDECLVGAQMWAARNLRTLNDTLE